MNKTAILFLIFNRPETTKRVFDAIKKYQPKKLYLAADGPRSDKIGEKELCQKTRAIVNEIDWDCEVSTLFREKNLGLKVAVSSAIDWFFKNENEGIILEDDCLPNPTFFRYCSELLEKYRNVDQVKMISGDNFQFGWKNSDDSYYFSKYCNIWGWATWKRAWKEYDLEMKSYPEFVKSNKIDQVFKDKSVRRYWRAVLDRVFSAEINTWDYQWVFCVWSHNGLAINPSINLVANLGCNSGTNTAGQENSEVADMKSYAMKFPLKHPTSISQSVEADDRFSSQFFKTSYFGLIVSKAKRFVVKYSHFRKK
ncbi:MAG: hypothetical protein WC451_03855 [Patescibacteria group bacterium]|jgi:hypothetical protein